MDDVAVIHIDFPPNATVADVHRLFAENRPPPGQCNFNLTSNTFMPAPVVTAIMQIVHGPDRRDACHKHAHLCKANCRVDSRVE